MLKFFILLYNFTYILLIYTNLDKYHKVWSTSVSIGILARNELYFAVIVGIISRQQIWQRGNFTVAHAYFMF